MYSMKPVFSTLSDDCERETNHIVGVVVLWVCLIAAHKEYYSTHYTL